MRITLLARIARPAIGGTENFIDRLARDLSGTHDVEVLAQDVVPEAHGRPQHRQLVAGAQFEAFKADAIWTRPLALQGRERLSAYGLLARSPLGRVAPSLPAGAFDHYARCVGHAIARQADAPDVLHVFTGSNFAAAAVDAGSRLGVPVVITPLAHPGQFDDDPNSARTYRKADAVMATNEPDRQFLRGLGVAEERLSIAAPVSDPPVRGLGGRVRGQIDPSGGLVVFVGRRVEHKGLDLLLEATRRVAIDHPGVTLALIGGGPAVAAPPGVRLLDVGRVDDEEKSAWLEAADVVCLPSAFESFGLVVAEAWSVGTPVVTSRTPALLHAVEASGGGWAVDRHPEAIAAALASALDDPGAARAAGAAGRRFWEAEWSPAETMARVEALYGQLTGRPV